jgi:hypothetical protein
VEAKKAKEASPAAPSKPPAPPATAAPAKARASPLSTPPRASASKPPLPPKERTPPRRASLDGGEVLRDEKEKPAAAARSEPDAAGFAAVEVGEGAESVDGNSDDEIDAWLAE